jgi:hypothetical protein
MNFFHQEKAFVIIGAAGDVVAGEGDVAGRHGRGRHGRGRHGRGRHGRGGTAG